MSWAAAAIRASRAAPLPTRRRAHSNRHTVAAAARFSDSARPACGTRTVASASRTTSCGDPCASFPNTNATGPPRSSPYRFSEPSTSIAKMRKPAPRKDPIASAVWTPRTTGRWKSDPADARTVLGLYTSTDEAVNTTADAPAASADRMTVPAFPGSRTSCRTVTHEGSPCGTADRSTSRYGATPTIPWGVTVEVSFPRTSWLTWLTSTPRCDARAASGSSGSVTRRATTPGGSRSNASEIPWAPSTRNECSRSRAASFLRRATAATFGFLRLVSTGRSSARSRRSGTTGVYVRSDGRCDRGGAGSGGGRLGCFLDRLHERRERRGIVDGKIREDLAIDLDAARLQPVDEPRVGQAVRPDGGVDPSDPQSAELAFAVAAVTIGVQAGVVDLLLGDPVADPPAARVALGSLEHLAALLLRVDRSFHPCHVVTSPAGASTSSALWSR